METLGRLSWRGRATASGGRTMPSTQSVYGDPVGCEPSLAPDPVPSDKCREIRVAGQDSSAHRVD